MLYKNQSISIYNVPVKQVTEKNAEIAFNIGKKVYFHPCNLRLDNYYQMPMLFHKDNLNVGSNFRATLDAFRYYNCNSKTGYRVLFFVEL